MGVKLLGAIAILLWAGACAPITENWSPGEDVGKQTTVAWTVSRHEVRFAPGTEQVAAGEAARLEVFLAAIDLRRPTHVFVGAGAANKNVQLAARRTAAAHALLRKYGVSARVDPPQPEPGTALDSLPSGADRAVILAGRFEIHVTGCPDWRKPVLDEFSNYQSSNFGCASANNLALMIAAPEDLLHGREGGFGDGERAAAIVREYRSGALPEVGDNGAAFVSIPSAAAGGN